MKPLDILRLYKDEYSTIELDLNSAATLEQSGDLKNAGERYKTIARNLLKLKLTTFAIDYYLLASDLFIKANKFEKAIGTELTIYQVYRIENNVIGMANTYEKIASYYKYYLNNNETAGSYYLMSAKYNERNQNYLSAFKKARFACECFEHSRNIEKRRTANSLAFRMALQSRYYERAGIHAKKWLDLMPKDYSPHYISICMKGYRSFIDTDRADDAFYFVNEIIIAHYDKGIKQEKVIKYLIDGQKLYIKDKKEINEVYNRRILIENEANIDNQLKYSIELKAYSNSIGLEQVADFFYLQEKELIRQKSRNQKQYYKYVSYSLWKMSCSYGTSLFRWFSASAIIIVVFGLLYSDYNFLSFENSSIKQMVYSIKPNIKITSVNNWFSPYYYSVVTFATLGYGDILPSNLSGQIFSVVEVLTGYLMLGGLLSVFSKKMIR